MDLNGFNTTLTNPGAGGSSGAITDNSTGNGTTTLTISVPQVAGLSLNTAIKDGVNGQKVGVALTDLDYDTYFNNGGNTFSGGLTLLNGTRYGTRLDIGTITSTGSAGAIISSNFGTGPITVGQAATDHAGIYMVQGHNNQTLLNNIIFNTTLGNDIPGGLRVESTGFNAAGTLTANLADVSLSSNGAGSALLTGQITGQNGLSLLAGGGILTVTMSNTTANANNYQGNTTINSPNVLVLGAANQIPNGANAGNMSLGGTFNLNGFNAAINGLSGAGTVNSGSGSPTFTVGNNNATSTFSGVMQNTAGTLALTKVGSGTLTLSGSNTYLGSTTVSSGTLQLGTGASGHDGSIARHRRHHEQRRIGLQPLRQPDLLGRDHRQRIADEDGRRPAAAGPEQRVQRRHHGHQRHLAACQQRRPGQRRTDGQRRHARPGRFQPHGYQPPGRGRHDHQ